MELQEDQNQKKKKKKNKPSIIITPKESEGEKDTPVFSRGREGEKETTLSARVVSLLLGDATGQAFENWVALVRKRSGIYRPSGFPNRLPKIEAMPSGSLISNISSTRSFGTQESGDVDGESENLMSSELGTEPSLWERLGNAAMLDIESGDFSWDGLSSLHHTEHTSSAEHSEDEMNRALEVTVNSGGVVFFALFNTPEETNVFPKEAAAVLKIASSRMATLSERLGYEFAKWLGVRTPQARVVHNACPEWQTIKDSAENAREAAISIGDESGEITCSELLEALEMSRCLLLMNYVHGSPLLESSVAFGSQEAAAKTAATFGRVLMLDLILRNEDRLPCRQLGWRGNPANLLLADKVASAKLDALEEIHDVAFRQRINKTLKKERRAYSVSGRLVYRNPEHLSQNSSNSDNDTKYDDFHIVAIDSGVPRRPPAGKRARDQERYPKVVELILNNSDYSSNLLYEISGGKLGFPPAPTETTVPLDSGSSLPEIDMGAVVHEFRGGFRAALRDLQGFHLFLLTLYQKLDGLLRIFLSIISKSSEESDKDDCGASDSPSGPSHSMGVGFNSPAISIKERFVNETHADSSDSENLKFTPKSSPPCYRGSPDSSSRDNWTGKYSKASADASRSLRMTMKLRDFQKNTKVDAELNKELEQWNEMLRTDVIKLCQENNFNPGFFEGNDSNIVVDAYELKVRLEHILERAALITDAVNTERPSLVKGHLFIGGALVARSVHTLQLLGITHILCLCSNEIGQSDSQYPELFEYMNFSISDSDDSNISDLFEEACDFIDNVEHFGGKVLVHCFEGKSRSATVVLAYLMLRKKFTLLEAWSLLKRVHRRAQPNDGFGKALLDLDHRLHGRASMDWQHRRPAMKICPICGKNAGLSTSSLKLHLQKSHKKLSSGSVDSAMTLEIQKALEGLKISRSGSDISPFPSQKQSRSPFSRFSY